MTRRSIEEYAKAVRGRYFRASKKTKAEILNEFVATTGMHRKAAIRLLNRRNRPAGRKRSGRPKLYDLEVMAALKVAWEAAAKRFDEAFTTMYNEAENVAIEKVG